ncbi:MAG TPA: TolC family protein [Bacteroidales bacterium]|nr:TolC family protein [Bacteroidales bacterium]
MKELILIIIFLLTFSGRMLFSQKKWTIEDCINYAVQNNIQLKRQKLQTETYRANLTRSRLNLLPDLNIETDGNLGFGRSVNPVNNSITFQENISNSYSIKSSITLFSGFTNLNTLASNKFMFDAGVENEKILLNNLVMKIMGAFYQVVYSRGLEAAAAKQLESSQKELNRIKKNVEVEKESVAVQYEMESTVSYNKLLYTEAVNTSRETVTTLKQLLQLEPGTEFEVTLPDLEKVMIEERSYRADSLYRIAAENLPRLREINYELMASKKAVAAAMGALSPRVIFGGGIFTGYYEIIAAGVPSQGPFSDQFKGNKSQAVYASLMIPIFNNYSTLKGIKLAKINRNDTELRLELEKSNLYADVENACLNYNSGKDEFVSALSNFQYASKSYDVVQKKFEAGLVDVTVYTAAETKLFRADTEKVRTKLQLLIRDLIIKFYATGDYKTISIN